MHGRALVTTLPNSGEALVTSFLEALGYCRWGDDAEIERLAAQMQVHRAVDGRTRGQRSDPAAMAAEESAQAAPPPPPTEKLGAMMAAMPEGFFLHGHLAYDARLHDTARAMAMPIVFVYRSPRAGLASVVSSPGTGGRSGTARRCPSSEVSTTSRAVPEGADAAMSFVRMVRSFRGWLDAEGARALRYEDLVGPVGGGSTVRQIEALTALAQHVGWRGRPSGLLHAIRCVSALSAEAFQTALPENRRERVNGLHADDRGHILADLPREFGYASEDEQPSSRPNEEALTRMLEGLHNELAALITDRSQLVDENIDHSNQLRVLRSNVAALSAECDRLDRESKDRLSTIRGMEERIRFLSREGNDRLATIRLLERTIRSLEERIRFLTQDSTDRLETIRQLQRRIAAVRSLEERVRFLEREGQEHLATNRSLEERISFLERDSADRLETIYRLRGQIAAATGERDRLKRAVDRRPAVP